MRLDSLVALCPIAFSQVNYTVETTWLDPDPSVMVWREERNFAPWKSYAWTSPASGTPWVSERYSPWQLLYIQDALDFGFVQVPSEVLHVPAAVEAYRFEAERRERMQRTLDERWRPFVKLLVALQTRLWPYRRQSTTLLHPDHDIHSEVVDPVEIETSRFDPRRVLVDFGLELDGLAQLHAEIAVAAMRLDPAPRWHRLAENAPRRRTDELRGEALRARDLHDAAFLLRPCTSWQPVAGFPARTRSRTSRAPWRRGDVAICRVPTDRITDTAAQIFRDALERQGLYPHRIHFVVEGETEEIVLGRLLDALVERVGYQVTNLRGVDKARQHEELFAAASEYAARTVLIADMEGSLSQTLWRLQRDGLLTDKRDLLLWEVDGQPSSFEEANFTHGEIADAIVAATSRRVPDLRLKITGAEIKAAFTEAAQQAAARGKDRPALAKIALKHARDAHQVRVSKRELGRQLAETTMGVIKNAGSLYNAANEERPLLRRLWRWLRETD